MPDDLAQKVISVIAENQRIAPEKVTIDSTFEELGIDSMDGVNIVFALESEFNISIPDEALKDLRSVRSAVEGVEKLLAEGRSEGASTVQP